MDVKKSQTVPSFTVSVIVTFFKRNNVRVKIRFSQVRHAISDFCCFKRPVFFLCDFLFHRSPSSILPETKRFAKVKDSSRFSALCDLPETIKKIFFFNFLFFKGFSLRKMSFLLFSVGEEWFSRLMRILSGIFWRCIL